MCNVARGRTTRNEEMINRILMNAKHRMMFADSTVFFCPREVEVAVYRILIVCSIIVIEAEFLTS